MTVLEELKESTRESIEARIRELERRLAEARIELEDSRKALHDAFLDIVGDVSTTYQVTVAEARDSEKSVEEVAELWKHTQEFYSDWLKWWVEKNSAWNRLAQDELFIHVGELLKKLERASDEQYRFHARE